MDYIEQFDMIDNDFDIERLPLDDGYPCTGKDCYDRGNYHISCGACPYHKKINIIIYEKGK